MSSIIVRNGELGMIVKDHVDSKKKRFLPCGHGAYSMSNLEEISEENDDIRWATPDEKMDFIKREYHNKDRIINTYEVGDYQIIEYTIYNPHGKLLYHPYIDYSDIHRIYNSLDAALLGIMAYKYEGCNYHIDEYMCKLLDIKW